MNKLTNILSAICAGLVAIMGIFFYGKKSGEKEANNENLQEDNQALQKQSANIQAANDINNAVDSGTVDAAVDELRSIAPKD